MSLVVSPLFSGSSGNCVYVGTRQEAVLADVGVSASAALEQLALAGLDAAAVKAVLVTHEHADHMTGAGVMARKLGVPVYATRGTWQAIGKKAGKLMPEQIMEVTPGEDFYIGGLNIHPFPIPHDCAEPCGFSFFAGGCRAAIATDIGTLKGEWLAAAEGSDIVMLESNYDTDMLLAGPYSFELKRRIKGTRGHLSNEDAGKAAVRLARSGTRLIVLSHLSKENNFPELALETVKGILAENDLIPGRDVQLCVAKRDGLTGVFEIGDDYAGM